MSDAKPQQETPAPEPSVVIAKLPGGKPDPAAHNAEMDRIRSELDKVHGKMNAVKAALSGESAPDSPAGKRRAELRAELEQLRSQQAGHKGTRGKVFDEIKALQDDVGRRVKTLQDAKAKAPFKSTQELDARVAQIEAQIETGELKIVEERKLLNEVSSLRRTRKSIETLAAQQREIDAQRAKVDQLRGSLDDPESQALNKRYDAIKAELEAIAREQEKTFGSRSKLLNQRTALSKQLDELYQARRERQAAYRAEGDKYYARMTAERERRQEAQKRERQEADKARQVQEEEQLREDAALPAFAKEIEDCDQLIRYFSGEQASGDAEPSAPQAQAEIAAPEGAVVAKSKDQEEDYFVGTGGKKGKNKKNKKASKQDAEQQGGLHVPFGMLSALLGLSIPPPANHADLARVVDNIKLKREYFVSNQDRVTRENIERVEKQIAERKARREGSDAA